MKGKKLHIIILAFVSVVLSSCSLNRFVPEGKYLVKKNKVTIEKKGTEISKSSLSSYIALKPYKTVLQTNIPTWIYYQSACRPNSGFWKWMHRNFGNEPVYYDISEANRSADQMALYLNHVGYFNSKVTHKVKFKRKKAEVEYIVTPAEPYRLNRMDYIIEDSLMRRFIMRGKKKLSLEEGDIYNEFTLSNEREIITERLKNAGYYFFKRDNIFYEVDSNFMNHTLSVTMKISKNELSHKRYNINKINIFPNYSIFRMNERPSDSATLTVDIGRRRSLPNTLNFYYFGKPKVTPQTFSRSIQILEGYPYNLRNVTTTYKNLSNFRLFNNINITFDTVPSKNDTINLLDCKITMQQNDVHSITMQAEGTKSDSDLGIKGSISYTNKNIFHGAETFQLSLKGGFESQKIALPDSVDTYKRFNSKEFGVTASLQFPKFLSPFPMRNFARDYQPTTTLSLGVSSLVRYYYSRFVSSLSFGYDWKSDYRLQQNLSPIYLNVVKIYDINPLFQTYLDNEANQRRKDLYTDHLIFGARYSLIYNTQRINQETSFIYLRTDIETSGNLLSLFNKTKLATQNNGSHEVFGIRYAQYVRASLDFRQHLFLGRQSWVVFRQFLGFGMPYGNSEDIPFERSFYAGGANSLRGWGYHSVGPGSFVPSVAEFERVGDMQLELNAELRFPVYNIINGALFVDAGNVWNYSPDPTMPNAEFRFDSFYKQIALDAGVGLRLDVSFLILRFDLACALRNPYPDALGNYWRNGLWNNLKLNMGIGYPF